MAFVITIDGPGGSGKGTVSKIVADYFNYNILDSGAIYRVLAFAAIKDNVPLDDEEKLADLGLKLNLSFKPIEDGVATILDGEDISRSIRTEETGSNASKIASLPKVRLALLERQRCFAKDPGLVGDGRDLGTVVFPKAHLKIFLDATPEERARRRFEQLKAKDQVADYSKILEEIKERDFRDRNRTVAPLVPAEDAICIDTSNINAIEVSNKIIQLAKERLDS